MAIHRVSFIELYTLPVSRIVKHQDDFLADLRYAREQSGKSYLGQTWEALRLVLGPGHLSPWDYHRYRLWDDAVTADGPLVIEANFGSTFTLRQLSEGRGLLTPEFREFVRRATELNVGRGLLWPISWDRDESIWRLSGLAKLARSVFTGGARSW